MQQQHLVELHEEADLVDRSAPVLGRRTRRRSSTAARSSSAPSTTSNSASSPAAWPSVRFRPRRCAQRPLPSITIATWPGPGAGRGIRSRLRARSQPTGAGAVRPTGRRRLYAPAPMQRGRPERWTAVVNPAAGRGRGPPGSPALVDALDARRARRRDPRCRPTHGRPRRRWPATRSRAAAASSRAAATARSARSPGVAADTTACSRIVPIGSGNDFARHLGIPRDDIDAAVDDRCAPATSRASTSARPTPPTARRRGSPPSPAPASTPRPTAWANTSDLDERHAALRARRAAHARARTCRSPCALTVDDDGRRDRRVAGRGRQHAHATRAG